MKTHSLSMNSTRRGDPATNALVQDFSGGYVGTYGTTVQNGNANYNIAGPRPTDGFPGFAGGNAAAKFTLSSLTSRVTISSPWNLNTNTVTFTAWINPSGPQNASEGIVTCRGGDTAVGLNYASTLDAAGNATMGYTWDNEFETFGWNSGLEVPAGQWSFVALVVTSSNATVHVMNTNGLASATHVWNHVVQSFGTNALIGDDSAGSGGNRVFNGVIDDVAVFNRALAKSDLVTLFTTASGVANYAPIIAAQPTNLSLFMGQTAQFTVVAGGSDPVLSPMAVRRRRKWRLYQSH